MVKYADYNSAKQAYESPKVIFDNRFVKVYWYKPEAVKQDTAAAVAGEKPTEAHGQPAPSEDTEMIDPEAFALKQAEAQAAHEAKAAKLKEAEAQKEEIRQKIRAAAEERRKLMEKLAAKTKGKTATSTAPVSTGSGASANGEAPTPDAKQSQTDALRAKLAELEPEAEVLGIPAEDPQSQGYSSYRGRGRGAPFARGSGYRGRGAPAWRGGGGGWRGAAAAPGGAVARLDNRPRSVELKAVDDSVDFGDEKVGEALRVYLFVSLAFPVSRFRIFMLISIPAEHRRLHSNNTHHLLLCNSNTHAKSNSSRIYFNFHNQQQDLHNHNIRRPLRSRDLYRQDQTRRLDHRRCWQS